MIRKYGKYGKILFLGAVVALTLAGLFFEPEIVSIYWHVRFGNSRLFAGWGIRVPAGWRAQARDGQLIFLKMRRLYDKGDPAAIIVGTLRSPRPLDLEALKEAAISLTLKEGYHLEEGRTIRTGNESGFCLRFSAIKGRDQVHITSDLLPVHLSLDFCGGPSEIRAFDSVMAQIQLPPTPH